MAAAGGIGVLFDFLDHCKLMPRSFFAEFCLCCCSNDLYFFISVVWVDWSACIRRFMSLLHLLVAVLIKPVMIGRLAASSLLTTAAIRSAAEMKMIGSVADLIRLVTSFSEAIVWNSFSGRQIAFSAN